MLTWRLSSVQTDSTHIGLRSRWMVFRTVHGRVLPGQPSGPPSSAAAIAGRALNWARPVLASAPVQKVLRQLADRSTGPSEEELRAGRSRFWGEVGNAAGDHRTARLETAKWLPHARPPH